MEMSLSVKMKLTSIGVALSLIVYLMVGTLIEVDTARHSLAGLMAFWIIYAFNESQQKRKSSNINFEGPAVRSRLLLASLFGMFSINTGYLLMRLEWAVPSERDGRFVLERQGRLIRQLSQLEFEQLQIYSVRLFAGLLLFLFLFQLVRVLAVLGKNRR